jgi:1-acyl-sn-glycerol-3-phosphate acyltransferase
MKAGAIGLRNGHVLNIYPEGERAYDGELHAFKKGAAILATELHLPILPVALDGLQNVWARKSWRIRAAKVKIMIGEPFYARDVVSVPEPKARVPEVAASSAGSLAAAVPVSTVSTASPPELSSEDKYAAVTAHLRETIESMIERMRNNS